MGINDEYFTLDPVDQARVDAVIADAKRAGKMCNTHYGPTEYYAYPRDRGLHAWGVNGGKFGFNVKRGVM